MTDRWTATAVAIGHQILTRCEEEGDGLWWPRSVPRGAEGIVEKRTPALWGGASGIALFLLELYGVTGDRTMLDAARRALRWCVREAPAVPRERRAGFMNGGLGVAYVLCRAYDLTGEEMFLAQARTLALELVAGQARWPICDLLSGLAGTILVLAHVESRFADHSLAQARERLLHELIGRSRAHRTGIFWDASPRWALPLCGMAHGPSGIAFVLSELLGSSTTAPDHPLRTLIRDAFAYEDQYYSETVDNWPDHRSLRSADAEPEFMNGWCHGAAGIALARLGAAELGLDRCRYSRAAVATTLRDLDAELAHGTLRRSLTLCHGLTGLAELLLYAGGPRERAVAEEVGDAVVAQFERLGSIRPGYRSPDLEDSSLFVGSAGAGLFLLRLRHGSRVPSILRPSLPANRLAPPDAEWVWQALEEGFFRRTQRFLQSRGRPVSLAPQGPDSVVGEDSESGRAGEGSCDTALVEQVRERLSRRIRRLRPPERERAEDVLALESMHIRVWQRVKDYVELCRGWRLPEGGDGAGDLHDDVVLVLRPGVWVHRTRWDWSSDTVEEPSSLSHRGGMDVMIVVGIAGSTERPLTPIAAHLIRGLQRPAPLSGILAELDEADRRTALEIARAGLATGLLLLVEGSGAG